MTLNHKHFGIKKSHRISMKHKNPNVQRAHDIVEGIGLETSSLERVNGTVVESVEFHKHEGVLRRHPVSRPHLTDFAREKHDEAIRGVVVESPDYVKHKKQRQKPYKKQVVKKPSVPKPKFVMGRYDSLVDDEKKFVVIDLKNNVTIEGVIIKLK